MTNTVTPPRRHGRTASARRGRSSRPGSGKPSVRKPAGPSMASRRAYDRRERRRGGRSAVSQASPRELARRIPFVVLILALFAAGMGLTLWLTSSATARSHRIAAAEQENTSLQNKKEALEQFVQSGNSAPELARKAADLGMVQAKDVARLVVAPDGSVTVEGEPTSAEGPPPHDLARVPEAPDSSPEPASQPAPSQQGAPDGRDILPPADAPRSGDTDVLASSPEGRSEAPPEAPRTDRTDRADDAGTPASDAPPIPPADPSAPPTDTPPSDTARGGDANSAEAGGPGAD